MYQNTNTLSQSPLRIWLVTKAPKILSVNDVTLHASSIKLGTENSPKSSKSLKTALCCLFGPFGRSLPRLHVLQPIFHCRIRNVSRFEKALGLSFLSVLTAPSICRETSCHVGERDVPAFIKVMSGLVADLIQIPEPHLSHQARVISLPLSPFCTYCLGSGLDVSISGVLTKR